MNDSVVVASAVLVGADKVLLNESDLASGDDERGFHHEIIDIVRRYAGNSLVDGALKILFDSRHVGVEGLAVYLVGSTFIGDAEPYYGVGQVVVERTATEDAVVEINLVGR